MDLKSPPTETTSTSLYLKSISNIIRTSDWLSDKHKEFFKEYDLTTQQHNVLRILSEDSSQTFTINMLKDRIVDKQCDASRLVGRLESKKLITRKPNINDRRSANIAVTEKGKTLLSDIDKTHWQIEELMTELTEEEIKTLNTLLKKIRTNP